MASAGSAKGSFSQSVLQRSRQATERIAGGPTRCSDRRLCYTIDNIALAHTLDDSQRNIIARADLEHRFVLNLH